MANVLIIDDDVALCRSLEIILKREGHTVRTSNKGKTGLADLGENSYDVVFIDLVLPDLSGLEVIQSASVLSEALTVMITGVQDAKAGIQAIQLGAFDYVRKPLDRDELLSIVERARRFADGKAGGTTRSILSHTASSHEIIGSHPKTTSVIKQVALLSRSRVPVLIQGETGTGKELVARALHEAATSNDPFLAVNCSAVVPTLLESELFGHVRGAFTGADSDKAGKMELAGSGTVFFDEIGDMSYDLQAKLLRVLQEREFERVGSSKLLPFRARAIAATHRNLKKMVQDGVFREDLYYRVAVSAINVPSLRERRSDIECLVEHALSRLNTELGKEIHTIDERAIRRCLDYDWPGNVRELINVLTRAVLLARGPAITEDLIDMAMQQTCTAMTSAQDTKTLREAESEYIYKALLSNQWNIKRTARLLEISPITLRKKIRDYQLVRPTEGAT
ncbi:MAG: sigma-54-dependent Fis family transcriptional regulator [Candidatus Hydrogenedentes bacterium]|nr:sigma-54-dependent Fis family transcriptional regulator [Candidatus Hydrogenedentota bacterium]